MLQVAKGTRIAIPRVRVSLSCKKREESASVCSAQCKRYQAPIRNARSRMNTELQCMLHSEKGKRHSPSNVRRHHHPVTPSAESCNEPEMQDRGYLGGTCNEDKTRRRLTEGKVGNVRKQNEFRYQKRIEEGVVRTLNKVSAMATDRVWLLIGHE